GQVTAFTPLYLPRLGIPESEIAFWVGAIASFSNFVGLPFLPFWGALADRYGRKPLIIRSFVTAFIALGLAVIAPNVWVFAFSRAFQSLGLGNTGLMLATLAEHAPAARTAFAFGVVNGANPLGAFVGPLIGGRIVGRFGFPTLIAADALAVAGVVALLSFGCRDGFVPRAARGSVLRVAGDGGRDLPRGWRSWGLLRVTGHRRDRAPLRPLADALRRLRGPRGHLAAAVLRTRPGDLHRRVGDREWPRGRALQRVVHLAVGID